MSVLGGGVVFSGLAIGCFARRAAAALLALSWLSRATAAHATYSIVVADSQTGQTGIAVASCVGAYDLAPLLRVVPGFGAVEAQAHTSFYGQSKLVELSSRGLAPKRSLELVTDPAFDPRRALRQYAVVDFWGRAAAFSGEGDGVWAGHRQGSLASVHYSAQGNLLTGDEVLLALESGLERADACDLPERLMFALEEVIRAPGRGDQRCTPLGVSADSGYLRVAGIDGSALLELNVRSTGTQEPAVPLRQAYDAFRLQHPCGSLPSEAVTCTSSAGLSTPGGSASRSPPGRWFSGVLAPGAVAVALVLLAFLARLGIRDLRVIPGNRGVGS
jgi:uncharacterized Ntn-hydrolase superfamily protein